MTKPLSVSPIARTCVAWFLSTTSLWCLGQVAKEAPGQAAGAVQANPQTTQPPVTPEAFIDQLKKTVVFIDGSYVRRMTVRALGGSESRQDFVQGLRGTGFLVSFHETVQDSGVDIYYVVTNKHMIREPGPTGVLGQGPYLSHIDVRVNTRVPSANGDSFTTVTVPVMNDAGQMSCYVDTADEDADLALCPIAFDVKEWDSKTIPSTLFAAPDKLKSASINESNEILFAGLFTPFTGVKRNYPVVRHGKIAMLAGERVPIQSTDRTADVYLGDVMSFGGNSGSPVMVKWGGLTDSGLSAGGYYLLGVMQGYFNTASPVAVQRGLLQGVASENTGVAFIVPAQKILDVFNLPEQDYCKRVGIELLLERSGKPRQAFDMALENEKRGALPNHFFSCEYLQYQIIVRSAKVLQVSVPQLTRKEFPDQLPTLIGRVNAKSSVHVEFSTAQAGMGMTADLFLIFDNAEAYGFLPAGYDKAEPELFIVPRSQVTKISFIQ